jgi:excisionase family DNA binding protein
VSNEQSTAGLSTVQEIANRLHLHVQTVRLLIKSGELGHVQVGKYKLVADDQLAAFIAARRSDVAS